MRDKKYFPCPVKDCNKGFKSQQALRVHFTRVHNRKNKPVQGFRKSRKDDE